MEERNIGEFRGILVCIPGLMNWCVLMQGLKVEVLPSTFEENLDKSGFGNPGGTWIHLFRHALKLEYSAQALKFLFYNVLCNSTSYRVLQVIFVGCHSFRKQYFVVVTLCFFTFLELQSMPQKQLLTRQSMFLKRSRRFEPSLYILS